MIYGRKIGLITVLPERGKDRSTVKKEMIIK